VAVIEGDLIFLRQRGSYIENHQDGDQTYSKAHQRFLLHCSVTTV
jgi:hypothetical protein